VLGQLTARASDAPIDFQLESERAFVIAVSFEAKAGSVRFAMTPDPVAQLRFPGRKVFQVVLSNLLHETTDGIVNAANGHLAHGGGVALAIARAAGAELETESSEIVTREGPLPTGSAVVTTAGNLPFRGVIHAVGPRQGE
jgi:hypothetical protein